MDQVIKVEDIVENQTWWLLQKIKEEALLQPQAPRLKLSVPNTSTSGIPDFSRAVKIAQKLEGQNAIHIFTSMESNNGQQPGLLVIGINQPGFDQMYKEYEKKFLQIHLDAQKIPKFRFDQETGVLHHDGLDAVLIFGDNTLEFMLLRVAFREPLNTRIDGATYFGMENLSWDQIRDTAKRLSEKIKTHFNIREEFFERNGENKYITRKVA